ncbi:hypothetical protein [Actinoplanes sp. N902-109]|uniref:hypothetical protein n=1 Tax=Actinoplanes sp. (strain N902-109) TaxID=649831 RepID=UPI0005A02900|nr:hypothetical protein [Actinoplanes sp. N902-109]
MSVAEVWGTWDEERARRYACDVHCPEPAESWFRGTTVRAPRAVVFRWLCQLRVAPYSYDLIDNRGRRSPRVLTPGLERLAVGQRFATIFRLVDFTPDEQITMSIDDRAALVAFGPLTMTYAVSTLDAGSTRLVVKLNVGRRGDGQWRAARRRVLAWGDLVMMRRQLQVLRSLAEATS